MKPLVVLATVSLCSLAAWIGWTVGSPPSHSEIIDHYSAKYVADYGGALSDCHGEVSQGAIWHVVVVCRGSDGVAVDYKVGARGQLIQSDRLNGPQA